MPNAQLYRIELSDNSINGADIAKLNQYKTTLSTIKLCNNKISTIDQVKVLKEIDSLLKLDLSGNDICKLDDYRKSVFKAVPQLECLDGKD